MRRRGEYPTTGVTAQVNADGTVNASSRSGAKATASVDETKRPTLAEPFKSDESTRKDSDRAKAQYRVELPKTKSSNFAARSELMRKIIRIDKSWSPKSRPQVL